MISQTTNNWKISGTKGDRSVAEVERQLEAARQVEAAVETGVKRAGRLRQAVLRAAFEGRL
jgi:hypothetical protein